MGMADMFSGMFDSVLKDPTKAGPVLDFIVDMSNGALIKRETAIEAFEALKAKANGKIDQAYEKGWKEGQQAVKILGEAVKKAPRKGKVKQAPTPE